MPKIITDKQLKKLLELKKEEMPSEMEWCRFERSFDNKMLSAVKVSWFKKLSLPSWGMFSLRHLSLVGCAGAVIGLMVFGSIMRERSYVTAQRISREYVQFVNDCMFAKYDDPDLSAGTQNLAYADDGINYVHDLLISTGHQQTLAQR